MDPTLLQSREPAVANSEHDDEVVTDVEQKSFRDFEVPPPQPPWRMQLEPPIEYDGQKYSTLIFDFDAMTTKDFIRAHREFTHVYKPERDEIPFPDVNPLYHAIVAAHRANVPRGVIDRLPARYWSPLRTQVLKVCGGSPEEPKA
jgi:hypothetical protein